MFERIRNLQRFTTAKGMQVILVTLFFVVTFRQDLGMMMLVLIAFTYFHILKEKYKRLLLEDE